MKLASLKSGRDGRLVVVSDDLAWCADATHIAATLQAALDQWDYCAPRLANLATDLAHNAIPKERFHERDAASPLPRAYQRLSCTAGASGTIALRQNYSDGFLGPRDPITLTAEATECEGLAEVIVVISDVTKGTSAEAARDAIRLIGLAQVATLPPASTAENAQSMAVFEANLACAFSPVFVTPDELDGRWTEAKLHGEISVDVNGAKLKRVDTGTQMSSDFAELIALAAKTRDLVAGTIIGASPAHGAEASATKLKSGDTLRIWMEDAKHHPIFGVIEQRIG